MTSSKQQQKKPFNLIFKYDSKEMEEGRKDKTLNDA